jgi:hypothetical protein
VIESGLVNVVSNGARGVWQFMPETAEEVKQQYRRALQFRKSTQAACDFILKAKAKFGSWTLRCIYIEGWQLEG